MLDLVIKNLFHRKVRTMLCVGSVLAGVFLVGVTILMNTWMYDMMSGELGKYMGKVFLQQSGSSYPPFDSAIPEQVWLDLQEPGHLEINWEESTPVLFLRLERAMMPFLPAKEMVIGIPIGKESVLLGETIAEEGSNRFSPERDSGKVILGKDLASAMDVQVGGEIEVNRRSFEVIGILESSSMSSLDLAILMPLEDAQLLFEKEGQISAVLITPQDVLETKNLAEELRKGFPALEVRTQEAMIREAEEVMREPIFYMSTMGVVGAVVAVMMIVSTMLMAISERTKDIGVLRAVGIRREKILGMIILESISMAVVGLPVAIALVLAMAAMMDTNPPGFVMIAELCLFALGIAVMGGLYPAWRASRLDPHEAMRYQ
jgi:putative ABC transport system permease protein